MIGEVQYGGRVTDDYDKRLLNTFAKVWFSDIIFEDNFVFIIILFNSLIAYTNLRNMQAI